MLEGSRFGRLEVVGQVKQGTGQIWRRQGRCVGRRQGRYRKEITGQAWRRAGQV